MTEIDVSDWVEMEYNGSNGSPLTFKGYFGRDYRIHVLPDGTVKQTGATVRKGSTILVHPEDKQRLDRLHERGRKLFVIVTQGTEAGTQDTEAGTQGTEAGTQGDDLTVINGIGTKTADRLKANGILTYADLVKADPADVADVANTSVTAVQDWQLEAASLE